MQLAFIIFDACGDFAAVLVRKTGSARLKGRKWMQREAAATQVALRVFRPGGSRLNKKRPVRVSACPLPLFDAAETMILPCLMQSEPFGSESREN
jgi:hypothetical protein